MAVRSAQLTLEEFFKLPEEKPELEYLDRTVSQKMSPNIQHSTLQGELLKRLDQCGLSLKKSRAFAELRATFGGASVVPDVSVYRWQRIPVNSHGEVAGDTLEPPDLAFEIVSPGQSVTGLVSRCLWYVAHGVQIAVLVDPFERSVLAFRPGREAVALRATDNIDLNELLPEFELTVEQLFASLLLQ